MENSTSHGNRSTLMDQHSVSLRENPTLEFSDIDFFDGNFDFGGEMSRMRKSYDGPLFEGGKEWGENLWLLEEGKETINPQGSHSDYINNVMATNIDESDSTPPENSQGHCTKQNGRVETKVDRVGKEEKKKMEAKEEEKVIMFIVKSRVNVLDDGYIWRKYGEKNIKKRTYPRSYYRCSHNGCGILKRVERSTEDSSKVLITYYGHHSHHPY